MDYFLTIAATDNSGGAGIQQDMKVAHDLGYWALSAITGITVQNFEQVLAVEAVNPLLLESQIEQCLSSFPVRTVKIGALCSRDNLEVVARCLRKYSPKHVVLDPVLFSTSGMPFLDADSLTVLKKDLFPLTELITPNKPEFESLTNQELASIDEATEVATKMLREWNTSILLKGGHFNDPMIREALLAPMGVYRFERIRKSFRHSHGTGCTLSSALACFIGKELSIRESYSLASKYLTDYFDELQVKIID